MTEPTGQVQVAQADLDNFAAAVQTASTDISTATTTIASYIQTLLANQSTPLPAGDEDALNAAVTALQAADNALSAIQPPAPAPSP